MKYYLPGKSGKGRQQRIAAIGHFQYMGNPSKEDLIRAGEGDAREDAAIHAAYMEDRPGSTGYFGPNEGDLPDPAAVSAELRQHDGPIWRMIVSVTEADAHQLDLMGRDRWADCTRSAIQRQIDDMGLSDAQWVGSMHRKEGHPHVHILLWDRANAWKRGNLPEATFRRIRQHFIRELYRPERERIARSMAADKLALVQGGQAELAAAGVRLPPQEDASPHPPRLTATQAAEFADKLAALRDILPGQGRIALAYLPPEGKEQVRAVADWLIRTIPDYSEAAGRYTSAAREMACHYSDDTAAHDQAEIKARDDLRDKLSQKILRGAVRMERADRDEVVSVAMAAIFPRRGRDLAEPVPPSLAAAVHDEVSRLAKLRGQDRTDAAQEAAKRLLDSPDLRERAEKYMAASPDRDKSEARLADTLAKGMERAAEYQDYRAGLSAGHLAANLFSGLFAQASREEAKARALAAQDEADRAKRRQLEMGRG